MHTSATQQQGLSLVCFIAGIGVLVYMISPAIGALLVLMAAIVLMIEYPLVGLTMVAITVPFLGGVIDLSTADWARQTLLRNINAPIGDIAALGAAISTLLHIFLYKKWTVVRALWRRQWIPILLFVGVIVVAGVAALGAYEGATAASLKFVMRAMLFSIGIYYFVTQLWITNRTVLTWVLQLTAWVGLASAIFGLGSLIIAPVDGFPRITAYVLRGIAPFGYNHNVLAEFLVVAIPAALYSAAVAKTTEVARMYRWIAVLITMVALGTFSRAAWLVIGLYAIVYLGYIREELSTTLRKHLLSFFGIVVVGVISVLFVIFLQTDVVTSSNQNRLLATDAVHYYSMRRPMLGYGPGMYTTIIDETRAYTIDFGDALDAHGMFQKVVLEMGYVGVLAWVLLLGTILVQLYRRTRVLSGERRYLGVLLFTMACSACVYQLFNTSYYTGHMWWPIGVGMAGLHILRVEQSTYGNFITY